MRHLEVIFREEAALDVELIYDAIARISQSHTVADRFVKRLLARFERMAMHRVAAVLAMI